MDFDEAEWRPRSLTVTWANLIYFERSELPQPKAKYVLGLTATPFRRDGQQRIIFMQCGPIRHKATMPAGAPHASEVVPRICDKEVDVSPERGTQDVEAAVKSQPQRGARQGAGCQCRITCIGEPHGVYSRYYGNVTGEDMRRHIEEVCTDDRFEQHRYNILDFSDATDFNPTERELLINSGVLICAAFTNHQVLIAAVVTRENVRAALERFHALGVPPYETKIFPDVAEARKWNEESGFASRRYSVT